MRYDEQSKNKTVYKTVESNIPPFQICKQFQRRFIHHFASVLNNCFVT